MKKHILSMVLTVSTLFGADLYASASSENHKDQVLNLIMDLNQDPNFPYAECTDENKVDSKLRQMQAGLGNLDKLVQQNKINDAIGILYKLQEENENLFAHCPKSDAKLRNIMQNLIKISDILHKMNK